jgi:hypothetical protein
MTPNPDNCGVSTLSPSSHNLVWADKDSLIHLPHPNLPSTFWSPASWAIDSSCTLQDQWLEKWILPCISRKFENFLFDWQIDPASHTQLKSLLKLVDMSAWMRGMVLFMKNDDYVATCHAGTVVNKIYHFATTPSQHEYEISLHFDGLIG